MRQSYLHYDVIEKIGEGGMSSVFLAEDTRLKRRIALKFLPGYLASDDNRRKRLKTEAQAAAALNHPHIAQIYAIEDTGEDLFIVMEYIQGEELTKVIKSGTLTRDEKIRIALQVAEAMRAAHRKGIIHRDIKSNNIMVDFDQNVKVLDFGLARIRGVERITKTATNFGTPAYMSPEQVRGEDSDEQTDIWSFGIVLYELFTGELPFSGVYEPAILYSITEDEPMMPNKIDPGIPDYIEGVIARCLQKEKTHRYRDFDSIIKDISGKQYTAETTDRFSSKFIRSKQIYIWTVAAAVIVLAVIFSVLSRNNSPEAGNPDDLPSRQYLTILPIKTIGGDSTYQVVSQGLGETLSGKLSQIERYRESFWVVPSSEVRSRNIQTAGEARDAFQINLAVEASLQSVGNTTRFIMHLIDADNDRQLDSKIIDVTQNDLASLQNNAVRALLEMLDIELNPEMENAIRSGDPTSPGASEYYVMGRAYLQRASTQNNINNAIRLFKKAVEMDSSYTLAYAALGESYWRRYVELQQTEDVTTAKEYMEKALELDSELVHVKVTAGIIQSGTGEYETAIKYFNEALETEPRNADIYRDLATIYQRMGLLEKAEETYKQAIRLQPELWLGYSYLGYFYMDIGSYDKATEQFGYVIELTPDSYLGYLNMGGAYFFMDSLQKAVEMHEMSLERETTYAAASNLGTMKLDQREYSDAARWYEEALKLSPNDYRLLGNLASAYELIPGQEHQATLYYRKAIENGLEMLEVNPHDAILMADIGAFYSSVGDSVKAVAYVEDALDVDSENSFVRLGAVIAYEQVGNREKALKWVNEQMAPMIKNHPKYSDLVADRRFQEVINDTL